MPDAFEIQNVMADEAMQGFVGAATRAGLETEVCRDLVEVRHGGRSYMVAVGERGVTVAGLTPQQAVAAIVGGKDCPMAMSGIARCDAPCVQPLAEGSRSTTKRLRQGADAKGMSYTTGYKVRGGHTIMAEYTTNFDVGDGSLSFVEEETSGSLFCDDPLSVDMVLGLVTLARSVGRDA